MPFVDYGGIRCHVRTWGAPRRAERPWLPAVVLLHGFAQSSETWDDVARRLASEGRFVAGVDFVGHGRSDVPADAEAYGMMHAVRVVDLAISFTLMQMGAGDGSPQAKVDLVGYSMGGRVAVEYAAWCCGRQRPWSLQNAGSAADGRLGGQPESPEQPEQPEQPQQPQQPYPFKRPRCRLRSLTLESAGLGPVDDAERGRLAARSDAWASRLIDEGVGPFMDWWEQLPLFSTQRTLPADVRSAVRAGRLANDAGALAHAVRGMGAHVMARQADNIDALLLLARSGVAVRYIAGELDEKYRSLADFLQRAGDGRAAFPQSERDVSGASRAVPPGCGRASAEPGTALLSLPDAVDVAVVPGAGHSVHLERPAAFTALLQSI